MLVFLLPFGTPHGHNANIDPGNAQAYTVSTLYDLDADGTNDLVYAFPQQDRIDIFSGGDEGLVASIVGENGGDLFSYSAVVIRDLNDDSHPDFLIGAPHNVDGAVYVFFGPFQRVNGDPIFLNAETPDFKGISPDANDYEYGERVAPVTDLDDDGVVDIRVRAWFEDEEGEEDSHTYIYSGATGEWLYTITGNHPFDPWQEVPGDVDGDSDVDQDDVMLVIMSLGLISSEPSPPDIDDNGIVDGDDLAYVVSRINVNPYTINFYSLYLCPAILAPGQHCHGCGGSSYVMPLNAQRAGDCTGCDCYGVSIEPRDNEYDYYSEEISLYAVCDECTTATWFFDEDEIEQIETEDPFEFRFRALEFGHTNVQVEVDCCDPNTAEIPVTDSVSFTIGCPGDETVSIFPIPYYQGVLTGRKIGASGTYDEHERYRWMFNTNPADIADFPPESSRRSKSSTVYLRKLGRISAKVWLCGEVNDTAEFRSIWIDSDDDGLPDGIESKLDSDKFVADTNDNGISDGEEDHDGDGLTNAYEISVGFDPDNEDTDTDLIPDGLDDPPDEGGVSEPEICGKPDTGITTLSINNKPTVELPEVLTVCPGSTIQFRARGWNHVIPGGYLHVDQPVWYMLKGSSQVVVELEPESYDELADEFVSPLYQIEPTANPQLIAIMAVIQNYNGTFSLDHCANVVTFEIIAADPNDYDCDGLTNECEELFGTDPRVYDAHSDFDNDGLSAQEECDFGTDPRFYDSDGDGLPDGWEVNVSGTDPLDPNTDGDATLDRDEDEDLDGLTNHDEFVYGSDPTNSDSDGDGVSDGDEVTQGSDPNDDSDQGEAPPPGEVVRVTLTVGDHSQSNSEVWMMRVGPISHKAPGYGQVSSRTYLFRCGQSYPISVSHLGTNCNGGPDYDYTARVTGGGVVYDPQGLLRVFNNSCGCGCYDPNTTSGKSATLDLTGDACEDQCEVTITQSGGAAVPQVVCIGEQISFQASVTDPSCLDEECNEDFQWAISEQFASFVGERTGPQVTIQLNSPGEVFVNTQKCDGGGEVTLEAKGPPMIVGATYVGVHAPTSYTVESTNGDSSYTDVTWEVTSGAELVNILSSLQSPELSLEALGDPGDVQIEARVTVEGEELCVATKTLSIVQYDQVNIRWTAFIPCEAVRNPNANLPYVAYGGDHRTSSYNAASYRCRFDLNIRVSDHFATTQFPIYLPSNPAPFGLTTAYDETGAEEVAGVCDWAIIGPPVNSATQTSPPAVHQIKILSRQQHNHLRMEFRLQAPMPLDPAACSIGYALRYNLKQEIDPDTGAQSATLSVPGLNTPGTHTRFPAHEVYFMGQSVFTYDPVPTLGNNPIYVCFKQQFPDMQVTKQTSP